MTLKPINWLKGHKRFLNSEKLSSELLKIELVQWVKLRAVWHSSKGAKELKQWMG